MKYISLKKAGIISLLLMAPLLKAQQSHTLFFMHTLPQANLTNPAVQIPCKIFVGFPLLSSVHFDYSNSYFSYNDIFSKNDAGELKLNPDYLLRSPDTKQQISAELHISLLNFGFRYKQYYFNFNLQDKIDVNGIYPVNMLGLFLKGNANPNYSDGYIGRSMDLSGLGLFANYYREWAFGVSKNMDEYLTLGVKAKLLFGKANINTSQSDLYLFTSDPIPYLTLQSQVVAKASPLVLDLSPTGTLNSIALPDASIVDLLLNRKNKGFATDFGFIYKMSDEITFSGSLLDLGFIRYTYSTAVVEGSANYQFNGVDYGPGNTSVNIINQIRTDLRNSYVFTNTKKSYTKFLPPKLYIGATYDILPNVNAGLMTRNELYDGKLRSSSTASLNAWYKKYITGSISWSYINGTFLNFGGGIGLRTPQAGLYVISDNVYGAFKYKSARFLNLRFGINFLFGCSSANKKQALPCPAYDDLKPLKEKTSKWKKKLDKESSLF